MSITSGALSKSFVVVQDTQPASPFEGQIWVDSTTSETYQFKQGSFSKISLDGSKLKERHLTLVNDIAEARYSAGASQENMDEVFYDVFVDTSKISSSNKVVISTGNNGNITIQENIESFETNFGDLTIFSGSFSRTTTDSNTGSYSVEPDNSGTIDEMRLPLNGEEITSLKYNIKNGGQDNIRIYAQDGSIIGPNSKMSILLPNTTEWHEIEIKLDWSTGEWELLLNGATDGTGTFDTTKNPDYLQFYMDSGSGTYIDDVGTAPYIPQNPELVSTTKNLEFTPSQVLVQEESDLPADTGIKYVISDSSGNSETIQPSQVGTEVSVSFNDGDISIKVIPLNDGTTYPTLEEYGVLFV